MPQKKSRRVAVRELWGHKAEAPGRGGSNIHAGSPSTCGREPSPAGRHRPSHSPPGPSRASRRSS
ncbi:Uncharacterized protein FKW44_006657 [Caligus rogercresseyi]|uniref:Uncharacterized protein n=1 Tax=Caligus rogercresseyi TaxID=217165 RepID=A0A7T8QT01_CALRO|nr:Uncharacterized protein FKW44_006657 [Caligus rogercresseyi]